MVRMARLGTASCAYTDHDRSTHPEVGSGQALCKPLQRDLLGVQQLLQIGDVEVFHDARATGLPLNPAAPVVRSAPRREQLLHSTSLSSCMSFTAVFVFVSPPGGSTHGKY